MNRQTSLLAGNLGVRATARFQWEALLVPSPFYSIRKLKIHGFSSSPIHDIHVSNATTVARLLIRLLILVGLQPSLR